MPWFNLKTFVPILVAVFVLGNFRIGETLVVGGRITGATGLEVDAQNSQTIDRNSASGAQVRDESEQLNASTATSTSERLLFTTPSPPLENARSTNPHAVDLQSTTATKKTATTTTSSASTTTPEPDYLNSIESSFFTMNRTVETQLRIEAIKQDILYRLGMTQIPDVSRINMTVRERRQILRLYKKSVEELHGKSVSTFFFDDDQFYANQFHSFTELGNKPAILSDRLWKSTGNKRIFFAVDIPEPADPRKETIVKSATLKLFKREVRPQNLAPTDIIDRSLRIEIYQILQLTPDKFLKRTIDSRLVSLDKASWEEFDVSRAVQDWIRDPSSNLGLEIACDIRYRMESVIDFVVWSPPVADNPYQSSLLPVMNALTQEKRILGRQKRSLPERNDCLIGDGENRCCRYPVTIHFRDINWHHWVIEPESYQAYYCSGLCPRDYRVAHRYARIKALIRERNPSVSLNLGCVETKMGNLNIAHYNAEGNLVVSVLESMFPLECMCA